MQPPKGPERLADWTSKLDEHIANLERIANGTQTDLAEIRCALAAANAFHAQTLMALGRLRATREEAEHAALGYVDYGTDARAKMKRRMDLSRIQKPNS